MAQIVGLAPICATGFSGHGFLQGPAVGELVADLCLGRPSFLDAGHFSTDRFSADRFSGTAPVLQR